MSKFRTHELLHPEHLVFEVYDVDLLDRAEDKFRRVEIVACAHNIYVARAAYEEVCRRLTHRHFVLFDCGRAIAESWRPGTSAPPPAA